MRLNILFFVTVLSCLAFSSNAQKLSQSGDLSFLKGQDKVNVQFEYDNLMVGKKTEAEYVEEKKAEREKEDGMGAGEKWYDMWMNDREQFYEPKFIELLNNTTKGIEFGDFPDAVYTLTFKVSRLEPGWNIGISRAPAQIDGVANFAETGNDNPLGSISILKAPGAQAMGYDFDIAARVKEAFAISGKRLGAWLNKKVLK